MNRQLKLLGMALMIAILSLRTVAAENPKIATVDMQKLFKEYHRTDQAQKEFNAQYALIQKGVNERVESIKRLRKMLQSLAEKLKNEDFPADEREGKQHEGQLIAQQLKMMKGELKAFSDRERRKVAKLKASSMQGIMSEIRQKVIVHSKKQGFDFVFDKSGKNTNQVSFFLYLKDAKDITANMLKELNKFAPGADGN